MVYSTAISRIAILLFIFSFSSFLHADEVEPNDDSTTASPIADSILSSGIKEGAQVGFPETTDFYSFDTIGIGTRVIVGTIAENPDANGGLKLRLYFNSGNLSLFFDSITLNKNFELIEAPMQTTDGFIEVISDGVSPGRAIDTPYKLIWAGIPASTDINESDNTTGTANILPVDTFSVGTKAVSDDYFSITVPADSAQIDVALLHRVPSPFITNEQGGSELGIGSGANLDLTLQDSTGTVIATAMKNTNHEQLTATNLAAGTYYLIVGGDDNGDPGGAAYFIGWTNTPNTPAPAAGGGGGTLSALASLFFIALLAGFRVYKRRVFAG